MLNFRVLRFLKSHRFGEKERNKFNPLGPHVFIIDLWLLILLSERWQRIQLQSKNIEF